MLRWAIIAGLAAAVLTGCQTVGFDHPEDTLNYRTRHGDPPSLVFSPPEAPGSDDPWAWYAGRRDLRTSTPAGLRSTTFETTTTYTVDRQWISNGRVRDNYHTTTYTAQTTQTAR
jgi:hypothetical protein